jgi:hypothetical protein
MRVVRLLAFCVLLVVCTTMAAAQTRQYIWSDIDCRQSRIAAWPGLKCRATNVVTSADETTADFVREIFEYGKSIGQISPVVRYRDADYVTFKDGKAGRTCMGFRRVGRPQRGGYDALTGGILCAPPGKTITDAEVSVFIDKAQLQPSLR